MSAGASSSAMFLALVGEVVDGNVIVSLHVREDSEVSGHSSSVDMRIFQMAATPGGAFYSVGSESVGKKHAVSRASYAALTISKSALAADLVVVLIAVVYDSSDFRVESDVS